MKKTNLMIISLLLLVGIPAFAATFDASADAFFIKSDARARGMGEAMVAVDGSASAMLYNPAGLGAMDKSVVGLSGYSGLAGSAAGFLSGVVPFNFGTISAGLSYFGLPSDDLLDSSGVLLQNIQNRDFDIFASYGRMLNLGLSVGGGIKLAMRNNAGESLTAFGFDGGALYNFTLQPGTLGLGLSIKDLGTSPNINVGGSFKLQSVPLLIANDISFFFAGKFFNKIGLEYSVNKMFSVRAGYKLFQDLGAFSVGFGFNYPILDGQVVVANYALNLNPESAIGQIHSFGLEYQFGKTGSGQNTVEVKPEKIKATVVPQDGIAVVTIMDFKNAGNIEKLQPLAKGLPSKTLALFKESENFECKDISEFDKPDAKSLLSAGVRYTVAGAFNRDGDNLTVQYVLVDLVTKEKFGQGSFETAIKSGVADDMAVELANRIKLALNERIPAKNAGSGGAEKVTAPEALTKDEQDLATVDQRTVITIMDLKNTANDEKLQPLSKGLPEKVIALLGESQFLQIKSINSYGVNPELTALAGAGVKYVVVGAFERKKDSITIQYMLVDVVTKERFGKGFFDVAIKKGIADELATLLAKRIESAVREEQKK